MADVKRITFEDKGVATINHQDGILVLTDNDGDTAYLTLDSVNAMLLASELMAWVEANVGVDDAEAIRKTQASLDALGVFKKAKEDAGL